MDSTTGAGQIALTSPVLYVNWVDTITQTITWNNFGDAGAASQSVAIALYQETPIGTGLPAEPKLLDTITAGTANTGSYSWIPANSSVPFGTHGLIIQVSLVSDPAVSARSTEPFTVPESGDIYYVNDSSTADDQYTAAAGSNRDDGKSPSQPLPGIDQVLRDYTLATGSVIDVDPGAYLMIDPLEISGALNYGLGIDQGFTIQGPANGFAATLTPANPFDADTVNLIQLEDASFVTINDLTLTGAGRGLFVQDSTNFSATGLTISDMAEEGIRIGAGSSVTLLNDITVTNSGLTGIYIDGTTGLLTGLTVSNSGTNVPTIDLGDPSFQSGVWLDDTGAATVIGSTIFNNPDGLFIVNGGAAAMVGDPNLTDGDGDVVHDNAGYGIFANGNVTVAGDVVYDKSDPGAFGIEAQAGATATENVVYASSIGIVADDPNQITDNRVYDNASIGIDSINDVGAGGTVAITGNVVYSNATGIVDQRNYGNTAMQIGNNLVYANTTAAITIDGQNSVSVTNNTIDQPAGDGINVFSGNSGSQLRDNILVIGAGTGINVGPASQNGFFSDYNMFDLTNPGAGAVGEWQNVLQVSLAAWQSTTLTDADSFTGNPLFVNPTGAEGVLGYVSPSQPGYDDDFHVQSEYDDFRGGSTAPILNASGKPFSHRDRRHNFSAIAGDRPRRAQSQFQQRTAAERRLHQSRELRRYGAGVRKPEPIHSGSGPVRRHDADRRNQRHDHLALIRFHRRRQPFVFDERNQFHRDRVRRFQHRQLQMGGAHRFGGRRDL